MDSGAAVLLGFIPRSRSSREKGSRVIIYAGMMDTGRKYMTGGIPICSPCARLRRFSVTPRNPDRREGERKRDDEIGAESLPSVICWPSSVHESHGAPRPAEEK